MGLEADAIAIATGELAVVETADALEIGEAHEGRPIPVAAHRTGDYCVVFFIIKQSDGWWRAEVVPLHGGDVGSYGGGTGGIVRRAEVELGKPFVEGEGRWFLEDGTCLIQVDGVSADEAVKMRWREDVVAEATVAAHGYFVLSAILPADADVTVESA